MSDPSREPLRAPFPWFGGKSRVAGAVWERFGDCANYVAPFAGSLAVMLARPHPPRIETVNDRDMHLANFWRAVQAAPDEVARHADWPVNEADLEARHLWLVGEGRARLQAGMGDPRWHDAEIAGWWVWGISAWIGGGWCAGDGPWRWDPARGWDKEGDESGVSRRRPILGSGQGVHRQTPHLRWSKGVHRRADGGDRDAILATMRRLAERLRRVRVACGDWRRVLGPSVTTGHGPTGLLLDPPYDDAAVDVDAMDCLAPRQRALFGDAA